jgi:hypothetical protein
VENGILSADFEQCFVGRKGFAVVTAFESKIRYESVHCRALGAGLNSMCDQQLRLVKPLNFNGVRGFLEWLRWPGANLDTGRRSDQHKPC